MLVNILKQSRTSYRTAEDWSSMPGIKKLEMIVGSLASITDKAYLRRIVWKLQASDNLTATDLLFANYVQNTSITLNKLLETDKLTMECKTISR